MSSGLSHNRQLECCMNSSNACKQCSICVHGGTGIESISSLLTLKSSRALIANATSLSNRCTMRLPDNYTSVQSLQCRNCSPECSTAVRLHQATSEQPHRCTHSTALINVSVNRTVHYACNISMHNPLLRSESVTSLWIVYLLSSYDMHKGVFSKARHSMARRKRTHHTVQTICKVARLASMISSV